MRALFSRNWLARWVAVLIALVWVAGLIARPGRAGTETISTPARISEGLRLFLTDWSAASHEGSKGDGLGPVFNAKSCVACHSQGGIGGAGGSRVDVMILTDTRSKRLLDGSIDRTPTQPPTPFSSDVFPGFATERSLVIHRFATDPGYELWRASVLKSFGVDSVRGQAVSGSNYRVVRAFRNTPPLFGAGLINAIPETVLETASRRQMPEFPEIKGRTNLLKDGRAGRFGWKAQTASLGEFVRVACANELGLENPGHSQSPDPLRPNYKAPGLDISESECESLTTFIAALPHPVENSPGGLLKPEQVALGREAFMTIGCAGCHLPNLGDVDGIYSDLLLHDMGQGLSDSGEYYGASSSGSPGLAGAPPKGSEWRTPPLWGLHNSAPYLHDGRARSVQEAIAMHGGEGQASVARYKKLDPSARVGLSLFLETLAAPPQVSDTRKARKR